MITAIGVFFCVSIPVFILLYFGGMFFHISVNLTWAINTATQCGSIAVVLFWLGMTIYSIKKKSWLDMARFSFFPLFIGAIIVNHTYIEPTQNFWPILLHSLGFAIVIAVCLVFVCPWIDLIFTSIHESAPTRLHKAKRPPGFSLWAGITTGFLLEREHVSGAKRMKDVYLKLPDACTNIIVLGGIGSGKTTRIINPMLQQLLWQNCGGLIFDIKSDFKKAVYSLANQNKRKIVTIGVGQQGLNLLKGLTPEMASSFLKSVFLLTEQGGDSFWVNTATELCKNCLGVLSFIPDSYSLEALYRYIFFEDDRKEFIEKANTYLRRSDYRQTRLLVSYMSYMDTIFSNFDNKVKQGVNATIAQVLSPFQHPDLVDTFCIDTPDAVNIEDVLNGSIFLVDLPLSIWGLGGKTVYTLIKLRFFNVLQSRPARPEMDQNRPIFFMCDEYQEIVSANKDGLSDLNFWDKSRSAKCIGIISTQSVNSFRAAIGDKTLADTIMQNFRQKFCFRTEDTETIDYLNHIGGKAEVQRVSESKNSGKSTPSFGLNTHHSNSTGTSTSWTERSVVDAEVIRGLGPDQAIAFLNIDGQALDDVINLCPVFVD